MLYARPYDTHYVIYCQHVFVNVVQAKLRRSEKRLYVSQHTVVQTLNNIA
jgi:hypothetical protein